MAVTPLDVSSIKKDFPLLDQPEGGGPLVYLDSAATSQKPRQVIEATSRYYETVNANVHRGVYRIAEEATAQFEAARAKVASFIGAASTREVVFTKNATESLNLVANAWGRANLEAGDVVVLTQMEHHSNIVPWHILADQIGLELRWIAVGDDGHLDLSNLDRLLDGARAVGVTAMSNVLGTLPDVPRIAEAARSVGAMTIVDACQYVPHIGGSLPELGADFAAFSGHKMCGPTGIGVLWGREELLQEMPPFLGGGEMINDVRMDGFTPNELPWKFEAGTPPIAEAIGLGVAVDYLENIGMDAVRRHEVELTAYALRALEEAYGDRIRLHGPSEPAERGGVISFTLDDIHPHDISQVLDSEGICVRAGHHCAKPLMRVLDVNATARASMYIYNDESDIDALVESLAKAAEWFSL